MLHGITIVERPMIITNEDTWFRIERILGISWHSKKLFKPMMGRPIEN